MITNFASLGLSPQLVGALDGLGFVDPFPIQIAAIPHGMRGRDIQGKAPTGSGKTLAFGLPVLSRIDKAAPKRPRALVLAPTRELAEQISRDLSPLGSAVHRKIFAIYGGVGYGHQTDALRKGVDVLVATPGRLEDLIGRRMVDLSQVEVAVVDEADRMADMGFLPAVRRILDQTETGRQTLLFSATLDGDVTALSRRYQNEPLTLEAAAASDTVAEATHHFWRVSRDDRVEHTASVVRQSGRSIVFTRTRRGADRLARQLSNADISAVSIHGGRSQSQRTRALRAFDAGSADALVATDVAARGIHVEGVASVIHYDPAGDHKDYLHRSGRTARAGATGTVVTMVMSDQQREVKAVQRKLNLEVPIVTPQVESLNLTGHRISPGPSSADRSESPRRRPSAQDPSGRRKGSASRSIFVGNLPWDTTDEDLEKLFGGHGNVERATIIKQKKSGRSKGFGFVDMPASHGASAIAALNGTRMGGRRLKIQFAK
jgi:superfamily II DNA/RNA helicase